MNREYDTREVVEEGAVTEKYATYTADADYFEVPVLDGPDETTVQQKLDQAMLTANLHKCLGGEFRDEVYSSTELVRTDYTLGTPEGRILLSDLKAHFPNFVDFDEDGSNLVGKFEPYKEPYVNESLSWYGYKTPSEELLQKFSITDGGTKPWYALKFDLVTKEVLIKVFYVDYEGEKPTLPSGDSFYSVTYAQDGTQVGKVDFYVFATPLTIRSFCEDNNLEYPLPTDKHKECDVVFGWGLGFDKDTLEYGSLKGYARYQMPTQNANLVE